MQRSKGITKIQEIKTLFKNSWVQLSFSYSLKKRHAKFFLLSHFLFFVRGMVVKANYME